MAEVAVRADNLRVDDADANTGWENLGGGGPAPAAEASFPYQGVNLVNRKVTATASPGQGVAYVPTNDGGSAVDMDSTDDAQRHLMAKVIVTDYGGLNPTEGVTIRVGSASGNTYDFIIAGSLSPLASLAEYPAKGGIIIMPIAPNVAGYRERTNGTPNLNSVDYIGMAARFTASSAKSENVGMDAIDIGRGLILDGGDDVSGPGAFQDFLDFDEGTVGNRFGYCTTVSGVFFVFGRLVIGSGNATLFDDSDQTVIFPDGMFEAGFSGLELVLSNASTAVTISGCTMIGRGTTATEDTRPVLLVSGTAGSLTVSGCTLANFAELLLTSAATLASCVVSESGRLEQNGAAISGCSFDSPQVNSGEAFLISDDPASISDSSFTSSGQGHAIEITSPGTYAFSGNTFNGYGADGTADAAIYNNSGGHVTLQLSSGDPVPTVRDAATSDETTIELTNTLRLEGIQGGSEVRIYAAGTTNELAGTEEVATDGVFEYTYSGGGFQVDIVIVNLNYTYFRQRITTATSDATLPITQVADRNYENPD